MQIVIDIPEEIYKASQIIDVKYEDVVQIPLEVIAKGTPLDNLRAEIQTEYDGILWHYNDYDDGWSDALKRVLDIIDKYRNGVSE